MKPILGLAALLSLTIPFAASGDDGQAQLHPLSQAGRISLTPTFTRDGNTAYFALSDCADITVCPQTLHIATRAEGVWSTPRKAGLSEAGYNGRVARVDWPTLSPDEATVVLSWAGEQAAKIDADVLYDFDLVRVPVAQLGTGATDIQPDLLRGKNVNMIRNGRYRTRAYYYNETSPRFSADGTLYFWTQREGGIGGRDIYKAKPLGEGRYGEPELLPAPINTRADDQVNWVSADGKTMWLTRDNDIYESRLDSRNNWAEPRLLGGGVNSAYPDFGAILSADGRSVIFSSTRPTGSDPQYSDLSQIWQASYVSPF